MYNSLLRDREVQYIALRDETSKTWRILDTWNEALKELDMEDDIPDDNPAVSILTESAFTALIKEAARLGVLENIDFGSDNSYELEEKDAEIAKLKAEISKIKEEPIMDPAVEDSRAITRKFLEQFSDKRPQNDKRKKGDNQK